MRRENSDEEKMEYGVPPKVPYYYQEAGVNYNNPCENGADGQVPKKKSGMAVVKAFLLPVLIGGIALALWKAGAFDASRNPDKPKAMGEREFDKMREQDQAAADRMQREQDGVWHYPNSAFFKEMITNIFKTPDPEELAQSDYEMFTSIVIDRTENDYIRVNYTLSDGTGGYTAVRDSNVDYADLQCFSNLEKIDIGKEEFEAGDLLGLSGLKSIGSGTAVNRLKEAVEDPLAITELKFYGTMLNGGMAGIEDFGNLETASFFTRSLPDLEPVAALPNLKGLAIELPEHGAAQDGFQTLYRMTGLESLYLNSSYVRDIDFIENMENLQEFTLINADITDLDILLTRKDSLEKLVLWHVFGVKDYSPVFELTELETLGVELWQVEELPSMAAFSNLKTLAVGKVHVVDAVAELTGLEELALVNIFDGTLDSLTSLKSLKKLWITDTSLFEESIPAIAGMENLEEIILDDSFIWTDLSPVLSMPNLKRLSLNDVETGIDFSKVSDNPSLETLDMNHIILDGLVDGKWNYGQEEALFLGDHMDFFTHFPGLKELFLTKCELTDISFVKDLPALELLDITDNRVKDLSPAAELGSEKTYLVLFKGNPVVSGGEQGHY